MQGSQPGGPLHLETTHVGHSTNIRWHDSTVQREDKELLLGQRGCVLWFTGGWGWVAVASGEGGLSWCPCGPLA